MMLHCNSLSCMKILGRSVAYFNVQLAYVCICGYQCEFYQAPVEGGFEYI